MTSKEEALSTRSKDCVSLPEHLMIATEADQTKSKTISNRMRINQVPRKLKRSLNKTISWSKNNYIFLRSKPIYSTVWAR